MRRHVHLGEVAKAVEPGRVVFGSGHEVAADAVIAGVGMECNIALAMAAGLEVDGGILVDEFGRTSADGIYAAGDVASFWVSRLQRHMRLESWKHAQEHGTAFGLDPDVASFFVGRNLPVSSIRPDLSR